MLTVFVFKSPFHQLCNFKEDQHFHFKYISGLIISSPTMKDAEALPSPPPTCTLSSLSKVSLVVGPICKYKNCKYEGQTVTLRTRRYFGKCGGLLGSNPHGYERAVYGIRQYIFFVLCSFLLARCSGSSPC